MVQIIAFLIPLAINGAAPFIIFFFLYRRLIAKKKEMFGDGEKRAMIWRDYYCTFESVGDLDLKTEIHVNGSWHRDGEPVNPTESDFRRSVIAAYERRRKVWLVRGKKSEGACVAFK